MLIINTQYEIDIMPTYKYFNG